MSEGDEKEATDAASSQPNLQGEEIVKTVAEAQTIEEVANIERILDLKIIVNVNIGTVKLNLQEVMALVPGSIIEVQKSIDDPLTLTVNNKQELGEGEVVAIGESIGLRLLERRNTSLKE